MSAVEADRLRNALAVLGRELDENVSVDVLAASVGLSGSRLMALATGKPVVGLIVAAVSAPPRAK